MFILFAYHASGEMLKNALGRCSGIFDQFPLACMPIMMMMMIYGDENYDEDEDDHDDDGEEEEEDV